MEILNIFQPIAYFHHSSHRIKPSASAYSSHHHSRFHIKSLHQPSPKSSYSYYNSSAFLSPSSVSSSALFSNPSVDPAESASRHVMHYVQQGLENIQHNLSASFDPSNVVSYAQQQRRFQPPPEDYAKLFSNGNMTNGLIMDSNNHHLESPSSEQYDESVFSLLTVRNAMIISFYSLIILVSLAGNLLVCKVAFGTRDMRTTTNLLIASLACSDIVMTVFNIPFNVVRMLPISWPFGELICVLVPLIQTSCVYVSTFTMTLIALHRLWTVRSRKSSVGKTSICKVALTVLAIWLIALTLSLPHAAFNRVRRKWFMGRELSRCMAQLPRVSFNFPLLLTIEVLITQYLLPLSITLVVYVKIGRVIARQGQLICKLSDEKKRRQSEAKRRRIFMLALAVATFATCWAPINLYLFLVDMRLVYLQTNIYIICHWFAMSSVCYNPIIYCWLNEKFRNGAKQSIRAILNLTHFPLFKKHQSSTTILAI